MKDQDLQKRKSKKLKKLLIYLMKMGNYHNIYYSGGEIDPRELKTVMASLGFAADE